MQEEERGGGEEERRRGGEAVRRRGGEEGGWGHEAGEQGAGEEGAGMRGGRKDAHHHRLVLAQGDLDETLRLPRAGARLVGLLVAAGPLDEVGLDLV